MQEAQPTAEDYERMKAEDRAAWAKTHQGVLPQTMIFGLQTFTCNPLCSWGNVKPVT